MLVRLINQSPALSRIYRKIRYRLLFPGLSIIDSAELMISGKLSYGRGASIGERARITVPIRSTLSLGDGAYIGRECEIAHGSVIEIGDSTSIQDRSIIHGDVSIGRSCSLSLNVFISANTHCFDLYPEMYIKDQDVLWTSRPELFSRYRKAVRIEDDCWLGINSVILPGVTIGKGAIIGANSVVTGDIPPYTVAVGAPARVIKQRLKFLPPPKISALCAQDLPYFYSGFALSVEELNRGRRDGGVYAERRFRVALNTTGAKTVVLEARGMLPVAGAICYGQQRVEISQEMRTVRFKLDPDNLKSLEFVVLSEATARWLICIASAQVE